MKDIKEELCKSSIVMDRDSLLSSSSQFDLAIQCSPNQNSSKLFWGSQTKFKVYMEKQKDTEQPIQYWRIKLQDWYYLISTLIIKLQWSRLCGTGKIGDKDKKKKKTENSEIDPHKYGQLNFNKRAKAIQGSTIVFNKWCWNWITTLKKKNESRHRLFAFYKNQLKMDHTPKYKMPKL